MNSLEALNKKLASRDFLLEQVIEEGETRLVLRDLTDEAMSPLAVDFTSGSLLHRLKQGFGKNQPLGRALGLKSTNPQEAPFVIDATAGLGTDTFVMAALGCRVRAIERSEVIFELLHDGKMRLEEKVLRDEDESLTALAQRFSFEQGDAREILLSLEDSERPDAIYLDPMYPDEGKHKSALPKKTMQMFRRLLDGDDDADLLFKAALGASRKRVIVKRPVHAPFIAGIKPAHSFEGKTARLDLYLV